MERKIQNLEHSPKSHSSVDRSLERDGQRKKVNVNGSCPSLDYSRGQAVKERSHLNAHNKKHSTDNVQIGSENLHTVKVQKIKQSYSSSTSTPRSSERTNIETLTAQLSKYKKELKDYNDATRDLEQKYMKINVELGEMQQKHERFLADRAAEKEGSDCSRTGSEFSLKRKYTQIFHRGKSFLAMSTTKSELKKSNNESECISLPSRDGPEHMHSTPDEVYNKHRGSTGESTIYQDEESGGMRIHFDEKCSTDFSSKNMKYFETPTATSSDVYCKEIELDPGNINEIYETLKTVINSQQKTKETPTMSVDMGSNISNDYRNFQKTISTLKDERNQFRYLILKQQSCLDDYYERCTKAQQIMKSQQTEIENLKDVNKGIGQIRVRLDAKLREMAPISQKLKEEQTKYEKVMKENHALLERIRSLQNQAKDLKAKMDDLTKRKLNILTRFKNAERDLRVFRNYNTALKAEKRKQFDEIQKLRDQLDNLQTANKRMVARQREISDKHCRELQKRVFELEQKLGRSHNSTSSLLQERDRLISELQTQVNTLVHNFEVSQKHIRVLRRHIHNAAGPNIVNGVGITARKGI